MTSFHYIGELQRLPLTQHIEIVHSWRMNLTVRNPKMNALYLYQLKELKYLKEKLKWK